MNMSMSTNMGDGIKCPSGYKECLEENCPHLMSDIDADNLPEIMRRFGVTASSREEDLCPFQLMLQWSLDLT